MLAERLYVFIRRLIRAKNEVFCVISRIPEVIGGSVRGYFAMCPETFAAPRRLIYDLVFLCFSVCAVPSAPRYRPQFLRYSDETLQAHSPWYPISTFQKNLGVGPPWGKFFPKNFFRDIELKICVCNARDAGNTWLKNCHDRSHTA